MQINKRKRKRTTTKKKRQKKKERIKAKRNTGGEEKKWSRREIVAYCSVKKKKKRERNREKKALIYSFPWRGRDFFCFFQIVFAARPCKLAPAQVMVDRCAFVEILVKSRADSTAKKYLVEIMRFLA